MGFSAPVPGGAATSFFAQAGAPYGISGNYLARTKQIESGSGSGVGVVSPTGAAGPFQFTRDTARRMGLVDPNDLAASADAAARLAAQNRASLTRSLGRAPSDAELYLAHQQGSAGASALLAHPDMAAADALASAYHGNRAAAAHAIAVNGGDPNAPAAAFTAKWEAKFNGTKAPVAMFASGFGSGQPYFGEAPAPGVEPPLPSSAAAARPVALGRATRRR